MFCPPLQDLHEGGKDIKIHEDLVDSQLYVCSPSVLHLFTDNFDYCSVEDFVHGILINEEVHFQQQTFFVPFVLDSWDL
jgi:hypothetical protein